MNYIKLFFGVLAVLMLVLVGCSDSNSITKPEDNNAKIIPGNNPEVFIRLKGEQRNYSYPLWNEKQIQLGTVNVTNKNGYFFVTFITKDEWNLQQTNVRVLGDLNVINSKNKEMPGVEKYTFSAMHKSGVMEYTHMIPINRSEIELGQKVFISAKAVVYGKSDPYERPMLVNTWAGNEMGQGPDWMYYIVYDYLSENNPGGDLVRSDEVLPEMNPEILWQ